MLVSVHVKVCNGGFLDELLHKFYIVRRHMLVYMVLVFTIKEVGLWYSCFHGFVKFSLHFHNLWEGFCCDPLSFCLANDLKPMAWWHKFFFELLVKVHFGSLSYTHIHRINSFIFSKMIALQILVLFLTRLCAKRKLKIRGRVKWLSLIDIASVQNTKDPIYWIGWVLWCFYWDIYDRKYYGWSGLIGTIFTCIRSYWMLTHMVYFYIPCVLTSCVLTYASFYNYLELHL